MKKFGCFDCDKEFFSASRDDILEQLYAHYMQEHREIITGASRTEKQRWMNRFEKEWSEAENVEI